MIVVANAGPLIALAEVGCFDLLNTLYGQIHIPPAVRDELLVRGFRLHKDLYRAVRALADED